MGSQTLLFVSFIRWASALSQVSISGIWPLDTLFLVAAKHKQGVPFLQWERLSSPPDNSVLFPPFPAAKHAIRAVEAVKYG